ncbi:uncharacterized protein LOC143257850 [Tachypleus tridentatus]|uniref:uncharacterized protein LOC143257850 n=1 Tax=Tachypleus tridentatus TaxID=6853 RepID=UPI003FD066E1
MTERIVIQDMNLYQSVKDKKYASDDPGYESVKDKKYASDDPGYESVKDKKYASDDPGYESVKDKKYASDDPGYESVKDKKYASDDPGYESVKDKKYASDDLGYESVKDKKYAFDDPGYELVKDKKYASNDPGYERVKGDLHDLAYANVTQQVVGGNPVNGFTWESTGNSITHMPQDRNIRHHGYESLKELHRNDSDATESYYEKVKPRGYDSNSEFGDPDYEPVRRHENEHTDPNYEKIQRLARAESDVTDPGYECVKRPPLPPLNAATSCEPPYEIVHRVDSDVSEPGYESVHSQNHGKHKSTSGHVEEFFNYLIDPNSQVQELTFTYQDHQMVKYMHSNTPNRSDDSEEFYETIPSKDCPESHVLETVSQVTNYNPEENRDSEM